MWEGFPFSTFWSAVSFSRLFHGGHSICSLVIACCFCELNFSTNNWHLASFPVLLFWNLYGWNLYLQMVFLKVRPLMNSLLHTPGHLLRAVVIHSRRGLLNGKWPLLLSFSHSVVSNSATRWAAAGHASCPSPFPWACSNSCPLSRWCHPNISSSVVPFSSCPQSFPPSGSFLMSQLFASGVQSIGVSASTSVVPMKTHDWSPLGWTGWISLQSKGLSRVSNTIVQKHQFFCAQLSLWSYSHIHTRLLEKP